MSLVSVEYCSLETPDKSAAPYAHQWQTKPSILGLKVDPALIRSHLLPSMMSRWVIADCRQLVD
jgi:hypothetical protein